MPSGKTFGVSENVGAAPSSASVRSAAPRPSRGLPAIPRGRARGVHGGRREGASTRRGSRRSAGAVPDGPRGAGVRSRAVRQRRTVARERRRPAPRQPRDRLQPRADPLSTGESRRGACAAQRVRQRDARQGHASSDGRAGDRARHGRSLSVVSPAARQQVARLNDAILHDVGDDRESRDEVALPMTTLCGADEAAAGRPPEEPGAAVQPGEVCGVGRAPGRRDSCS